MKKVILTSIILIFFASVSLGQNSTDFIGYGRVFGEYKFYQNDYPLNWNSIKDIVQSNELAYKEYKKGKKFRVINQIIGSIGGFIVGYQLGYLIRGGEANLNSLGIGAGITIVGVSFGIRAVEHLKKSVDIYNEGLKLNTSLNQ